MTLLPLLSSFFSPAAYSVAILAICAGLYLDRGIRGGVSLPHGTGILTATLLLFASLALLGPSFNYGRSGQNPEAFKFMVATATFLIGIALAGGDERYRLAFPLFLTIITGVYAADYYFEDLISQEALLYPPDNNHSAAMLAAFLPLVIFKMKRRIQIFCLVLFTIFAFLVASRALLALTVVAFVASFKSVRENRLILAAGVALVVSILFYRGFSLNNFSDQLRLQILEVSLEYAQTRGFHAFNFGEASFTNFLNTYPIYRRLEIQHAHNLILQIWAAYGIAPFLTFFLFVSLITFYAFRSRSYFLISTLFVFLLFGMIEALVTDIRAFGTIMFALGYAFASANYSYFGNSDLGRSKIVPAK